MRLVSYLLTTIVLCAAISSADVIRFKNGDRLTGEVERVEGSAVVLKTDALGEVRVPLDKLESYSSAGPSVVIMKGHEQVRGALTWLPSGDWQVETSSGRQTVPAKDVEIIFPAKTYEEQGYGKSPKIWKAWTGKGVLGYSQLRGDQSSRTATFDLSATRRLPMLPGLPEHSRTNYFLNVLFAKSTDVQGNRISTNNVTSGVRQDFKITDKNFWFLLGQLDHTSTQSLDLRQTYGGGLGRDLIQRPSLEFQALGGVTYVDERFQGDVRKKNAEGLVGEKFSWKLTHWLSLDHTLSVYPNLTDGGQYRFDTATGFTTQITRRLSLNTGYTDHFLSDPLPGHRKNEVIVTTGIGVSF